MSRPATHHRIRVLPPQVANQIAAGEVVERPASVVKELLENSLDAGAHTIEVDIELGGVQRIRIRDDGHGIHRDDLALALSPHATSKITSAGDLEGVISLGFRGEALASIASVSRLTLGSRRAGEESGWRISVDDTAVTPVALPPGTEIDVRDLFYNTPARRKFLRSERTELSHIEEVIKRIALSRFDLALRFNHNGKQILRLKPSAAGLDGVRRVAEVIGSAFVENSVWLDLFAGGYRLWGWLGRDGYSRSQSDAQYFYLNGRMIRDRLAGHAVRLAYGERIPEGRFPAYLLYLELDHSQVDVNVHPTKHEVRFREARQVHDFIHSAVKRALDERGLLSGETGIDAANPGDHSRRSEADHHGRNIYWLPLRTAVKEHAGRYNASQGSDYPDRDDEPRLGKAVVQLRSGHLLAESNDKTILVDMRALMTDLYHMRLTGSSGGESLIAQPLLIPESFDITSASARLWQERGEVLEAFGFGFGWLGDSVLVLRNVPAILRSAAIRPLIPALDAWLAAHGEKPDGGLSAMLRLLAAHAVPAQLPSFSISELNAMLREYETVMAQSDARPWREIHLADWQRLFDFL